MLPKNIEQVAEITSNSGSALRINNIRLGISPACEEDGHANEAE